MILLLATSFFFGGSQAHAQVSAEKTESAATTIGEIVGPDFTVKGQVGIRLREGRAVTQLESGNEVTVRRGQALVRFERDAGSLRLCQPMRASLLKSAGGLTVAFDRGTLRLERRGPEAVSLLTPWFTVQAPRAEGVVERALLAAVDQEGRLCLKTLAGEWLVREQLGSAQLAVPAGNEYLIEPNKLTEPRQATDACACPKEKVEEPAAPPASSTVTLLGSDAPPESTLAAVAPRETQPPESQAAAKPSAPQWKAIMPPLVFDASAASDRANAAAPNTSAVLVPATWQGEVTERGNAPADSARKPSSPRGLITRLKGFFRALFGGQSKKSSWN